MHNRLMRSFIYTGCLCLVALAGCSSLDRSRDWADPQVPGATLAQQVCSNCHAENGQSTNPMIPRLAGQTSAYIESQLLAIRGRDRNDARTRTYMWGPAEHLTNAQIKDISDYFSALPPMRFVAAPVGDIDNGRHIFHQGVPSRGVQPCASCHGQYGEGDDVTPRLAGQSNAYIKARARIAMTRIVAHLDDQEIENVAAYLASIGAGSAPVTPLEPTDEKIVKLPAAKLPPTPAAFDAQGDPANCHYSVWTSGWYCGDFWNAFFYRLSGN